MTYVGPLSDRHSPYGVRISTAYRFALASPAFVCHRHPLFRRGDQARLPNRYLCHLHQSVGVSSNHITSIRFPNITGYAVHVNAWYPRLGMNYPLVIILAIKGQGLSRHVSYRVPFAASFYQRVNHYTVNSTVFNWHRLLPAVSIRHFRPVIGMRAVA